MPRIPAKPLPHASQMVIDLLKQVRSYTMSSNCECTGQCTVERPGEPPTIIMYGSYPNGDYLTWFNDGKKLTLYSLVNEKLKHVMEAPATKEGVDAIIAKANALKSRLGT